MNDTDFHREQLGLFSAFTERLQVLVNAPDGEALSALAEHFRVLNESPERIMDDAPALVARMLTTTPQLAEHFPRDLLWYLGADCLHFMPDDEIDRYGALDEARRAAAQRGESFNWREAKAAALRLQ